MKSAKFFIIFTFLLAFAFQVTAQGKKPKIIWSNLQESYENAASIKPYISVESVKPIYTSDFQYLVTVLRYNEQTQEWENRNPYICGYAAALSKPIKLTIKRKIAVEFYKKAFSPAVLLIPSMAVFEKSPQLVQKGKYKFQLYYGLKKSEIDIVSESPEFEVIEYKPK